MLLQCFDSLNLYISLDRYTNVEVAVSFRREKSVAVAIGDYIFDPNEENTSAQLPCVESKRLNDIVLERLKTRFETRLRDSRYCSRDLVLDLIGKLSNITSHTRYRRKKRKR